LAHRWFQPKAPAPPITNIAAMPNSVADPLSFVCAPALAAKERILLGHGSGGRLSAELLRDIFLPMFSNEILDRMEDQAVLDIGGSRLAFTTDSFVVQPLFFPGGDIGSLAVHGTVNDLAMGGAKPLFLSVAFILEEGLSTETLRRIVASMADAAAAAGVSIVTGDTKVVERGKGDGVFINTTGIGIVPQGVHLSANQARPGDRVLLSGSIGDHGIAILAKREGLEFDTEIVSDSAPLHDMVAAMLSVSTQIRCLRDPTRGGLSSSLNEIAAQSGVCIQLEETAIPVRDEVKGACELLGLDPLYVANEGKLVAIVGAEGADAVLDAMHRHPCGREAAVIGTVGGTAGNAIGRERAVVTLRTAFGSTRIVDLLAGDQLPRIC
jgi:hydrogenase expression/formation protein HypE